MYLNKKEMTVYSFDTGEKVQFKEGTKLIPYNLPTKMEIESYNYVCLKNSKSMLNIKYLSEEQFEMLCKESDVHHNFLPKFEIKNKKIMLAKNEEYKGIVVWLDVSLITKE